MDKKTKTARMSVYFEDEQICKVEFHEITKAQYEFICFNILPKIFAQSDIQGTINEFKTHLEVIEETPNIPFSTFWDAYGLKIGRKERCEKLWKLMTDVEKNLAFNGIKKYNDWLTRNANIQKLYPETFLNQRRWENEYK
jgi:hypothetical protein